MTYKITTNKRVCIEHEDDWSYVLETDVYDNVEISYYERGKKQNRISFPYDGIQHFIDALNTLK